MYLDKCLCLCSIRLRNNKYEYICIIFLSRFPRLEYLYIIKRVFMTNTTSFYCLKIMIKLNKDIMKIEGVIDKTTNSY